MNQGFVANPSFPSIISLLRLHTTSLWEFGSLGSSKPINPSGNKKSRNVAPLRSCPFAFVLHKTHRVTPREVDDSFATPSRQSGGIPRRMGPSTCNFFNPMIQSSPILYSTLPTRLMHAQDVFRRASRSTNLFLAEAWKRVAVGGPNSLRPIPIPIKKLHHHINLVEERRLRKI